MESPENTNAQQNTEQSNELTEQPVVDTQDTEPEIKKDSPEQYAEEGKGIVRQLWDKIVGKGESTDEAKETTPSAAEDDIDDGFTAAAQAAGWSEQDIIEFAQSYSNEQLKEMIPSLQPAKKDELDEVTKQILKEAEEAEKKVENKTEPKPPVVPENLKPIIEQNEALRKKLEEIEKRLSSVQENREMQEQRNRLDAANSFFDKVSDKFPVFGKTETLARFPDGNYVPTSVAMKARSEVWKAAAAFEKMGMTQAQALEEAMTWYKGKHMEKDVHDNVLKELKRNEKRLSPKRTAKEVTTNPGTETEEKSNVVLEAMRRAGVNIN